MTKTSAQIQSALLIVDMQKGVVAKAFRRDEVIANINSLLKSARSKNAAVVWIQHSNEGLQENTEEWQIVPELQRKDGELLIHKKHGDSFEETNLEAELKKLHIGRLIIAGAQTDACIRATIHGSFARGFDTVLVSDAHTTEDLSSYGLPSPEKLIHFTNIYWTWQSGPGRTAEVLKSSAVPF